MAFMHTASSECLRSELDLWVVPPTQTALESTHWIPYKPLTTLDSSNTVEFSIPGVGHECIDPAHTLLYIKAKIVKADGSDIVAGDNSDATPVNYPLHALWSQVDVSLNQKVISHSSMTYSYRAYIEALLNYDRSAKDSHLTQRMWYQDTAGHFDSLDATENLGLAWRRARTANSRVCECMGPLHIDFFNQDHFLINNVEMRIKLIRNRDAFTLMSTAGTEKIKLLDATLYIRKVAVSPSIMLAHAQALEKSPAKYPVNRVDIKTVTITQGLRDKNLDNLFMNQLPQRVIIGFIDNRAFNGDFTLNGFNFQHFDVNYVSLMVDGHPVPSQPLTPDFENNLYMECYNTLFSGTGLHWKDEGNNISFTDYAKGSTLLAFDLSPDLSASEPHWNLQKQGTLRLELKFAKPLPAPINCLVYAEFQNLVEIDKHRNVVVDYNV